MSRQRLNAQGWTIRQMRVSVGGSRSVAAADGTVAPPWDAAVDKLCLKQAENSSFFMVGHPRATGRSQLLPAHAGEYLRPDLWSEHRTSSSFLIT